MKQEAVSNNDQDLAKYFWCFEQILRIQDEYIKAFMELKAGKFYDSWCSFERTEIMLHHLAPHFEDTMEEYYIEFINLHVRQFQSLFPYNLFFSPEYTVVAKYCSICGQKVSFRNFCGHRPGEIYNGEMCARIIKEVQSFGLSIVTNPKQKYSVVFKGGGDHYDYRLIKYLAERLASPFHAWSFSWTKVRHPHNLFKNIGRNDKCPCGSDKKYKKCCLHEEGVLRPHCQIHFSVQPTQDLSDIEYVY